MQKTHNQSTARDGWFALSRFPGILRYHLYTLGKIVTWVLAVLLGSSILAMLLPAIFPARDYGGMGGISANMPVSLILTLICSCIVARRSTRFLLRFGTPRFPVWLCNLLSLVVAMSAILLGSLLISILTGYLMLGLSQSSALFTLTGYTSRGLLEGEALLSMSLLEALQSLPNQLLNLVEWVCLYYFFGCCLRRKRWLTLTVVIGVPLAFTMLMVVPTVRQTVDIAMNGRQSELIVTGMQWMRWLVDALRFMRSEWPIIQLIAAICSLPLSYLCMRNTKQP